MHATLYDPDLLSHGKSYSNQFTNIFAGGAAFLSMYPDADLWARLKEQVEASPTNLQSPCGYMYEHDGPDLGYTLNTHHENLQMAYHYWRGTPLGEILLEEENRFGKWLSYNILPEPGQPFWVANRSIECRQQHSIFPAVDTPLADRCLIMRAFATPPERRAEQIHAAREKMEKQWPQVDPLPVGEFSALSPYVFLQRAHYDWHPTAAQMAEARKLVRPLAEKSFVEQLKDTREPIVFTYIRRPGYYAAFASAPKVISEQQRLGLTFVWTPEKGVLLQSQTNGRETAWGTSAGGDLPVEATGLDADIQRRQYRGPLPAPRRRTKNRHLRRRPHSRHRRTRGRNRRARPRLRSGLRRLLGANPSPVPLRCAGYGQAPAPCANPEAGCPASEGPVPGKTLSVVELHATGKLEYEIRPVA